MLDSIDDDISSSDSESEDYSEDVLKIELYKENIKKSSLDYDSHYRLIKALRFSKQFLEAREARENMNLYYPLSPEDWLEWISDEKSNGLLDNDSINKLFIRAIDDYRSPDVWFEYVQFILGFLKTTDEIRQVYEMAISQVGTNFESAYLIWGTYILYEKTLLLSLENSTAEKISEQRERIFNIYLRQLTLPLKGNDDTINDFIEWNDNNEWLKQIEMKYEESQKILEKYLPYEENIKNALENYTTNQLDVKSKEDQWLCYLKYAEENLAKCEIINLYERAITEICLSRNIWVNYLHYLTKNFEKDEERILTAHKRAVRNYRSSLEIWLGYTCYMEKYNCPVEDIRKTYNSIFLENLIDQNPFIPLWNAYLDFEKRLLDKQFTIGTEHELDLSRIRELFEKLSSIENYTNYDPQCSLIKYWAFVEAKFGKNVIKARELWGLIMKSVGNHMSSLWLENLDFERKFGDFEHLKRLAHNAINCFSDYPEYLFERVLRIIAEDGDLSTYMQFVKRIAAQQERINERRIQDQEVIVESNLSKSEKRKAPDSKGPGSKSKRLKVSDDDHKTVESTTIVIPKVVTELENAVKVTPCNEKSVFVSNLNFRVTEDDLRSKFSGCGQLVDVRLAKDLSGKSRGFAYVQFDQVTDVEQALKLERDSLLDRPMFVSRCNPDKRHSFQFAVGVSENTKLFVKNLPKTVTKHALETIFGAYGQLKDVRIVTFKTGAPKGIAYIEFFNEDDASRALVGTDAMHIGERIIEVKISNPPPSSKTVSKPEENILSVSESIPAEKVSITGFIVPRAVHKPMMTQKKVIHGTKTPELNRDITEPKKSNEDFRKFLK